MLFFGFFPPMFRGDWKWFGIILGIGFLFAIMSAGFLGWVPALVGAFIWNKSYLDNLIGRGYKLKGTGSGNFERVDGIVGYEVPRLESV